MPSTVSRTARQEELLPHMPIVVYTGVHPVDSNAELVKAYDGLEHVGDIWSMTGLQTIRWDKGQTPRAMRRAVK